jgi:hypothetical protein
MTGASDGIRIPLAFWEHVTEEAYQSLQGVYLLFNIFIIQSDLLLTHALTWYRG